MKKIIRTTIAALAIAFAIAGPASAHYVIDWSTMYGRVDYHGHNDCGRAIDWVCQNYPVAGPDATAHDSHWWTGRVWYQESRPWNPFSTRTCHTTVDVYEGTTVKVAKYC